MSAAGKGYYSKLAVALVVSCLNLFDWFDLHDRMDLIPSIMRIIYQASGHAYMITHIRQLDMIHIAIARRAHFFKQHLVGANRLYYQVALLLLYVFLCE